MKNFKPTKNKTALISNEVLEINRYNLKLNSQKLLFGLAQCVDHTINMFPKVEIDIKGLFKYLEIENVGERYNIIRDAFFDITEHPLQIKKSEKNWSSIPWMSVKYNEEDSNFVKINFHEDVKPYLLQLKEYTKIKGLYISKLGSHYSTWLYPILKMIQTKYFGKHEITIKRLKELTFTDDKKKYPAYNTSKTANRDFLRRVLGITKNRKTKQFEIISNSPLWEINEKTDIAVSIIEITKDRNKYKGVLFHVTSKAKALKSSNVDKSKFVTTIDKTGITAITRVPLKTVYQFASNSNMSVQEYCDKAGYYIKGNFAYKKMTAEEYQKMIKIRESKEDRRMGRQMTIEEVIKLNKTK